MYIEFVLIFLLTTCNSEPSFLDSMQKCSIMDSECLKELSETATKYFAEYGVRELGIPPLDPMHLKDQGVSVIGMVDVTLVDGVVEGFKECKLNSIDTDMANKITKFDTFCNYLGIKGIYNVKSEPLVGLLFGNFVSGDGNGSVVMEQLKMSFTVPFNIDTHDDDFYLVPDLKKATYSYEILDKVTFTADHILMGGREIAPMLTSFLNRNWKYVLSSFGKYFSDKGVDIGYMNVEKFFSTVPAKIYITDNLALYQTNSK